MDNTYWEGDQMEVSQEYINKLVYLVMLENELDYLCKVGMESRNNANEIMEYVKKNLLGSDNGLS